MSPSNEITSLLRDEAYLMLCRRSPEKVRNGAPVRPKGLLKNRLAKIDALEDWLKSALHARLRGYLQESSRDYSYSAVVLPAINAWEQEVNPYGGYLLAFACELKNAVRALAGGKDNLYASFNPRVKTVAGLRLSAEGLDRASLQLDAAARHLNRVVAGTIYAKVRVLAPPFAGLVQWMERLALLSNVDALVEMQGKELEVRPLLANKLLFLRSCATTARETVDEVQRDYLESYWDDLRQYALTNYVKECEVDAVLDEISGRYAAADKPVLEDDPALLYA
jgi:hypothetical protein